MHPAAFEASFLRPTRLTSVTSGLAAFAPNVSSDWSRTFPLVITRSSSDGGLLRPFEELRA